MTIKTSNDQPNAHKIVYSSRFFEGNARTKQKHSFEIRPEGDIDFLAQIIRVIQTTTSNFQNSVAENCMDVYKKEIRAATVIRSQKWTNLSKGMKCSSKV